MMSESEENVHVTTETDSVSTNQDCQLDNSKEHDNWLNVKEIVRSIQEPISIYVDEVVKSFHEKLRKDLLPVGECETPKDCNGKRLSKHLCKSCKSWFKELNSSHENNNNPNWHDKNNNNPSWHKNCKSAEWSKDHWEVGKFFMPPLGSNLDTAIDAKSTDVGSLLNVLEWLNSGAFLGKTRVNVDLVKKLRSEVRNIWAHAPKQKFEDDKMKGDFSIAIDFLEDLERVWSHRKIRNCLEHLKNVRDIGITNVFKGIKTCLPADRLGNFTGRETLIERIITLLVNEKKGVVSLHGGPGFGKTTIANELSYLLNEDHNVTVVFSYLSTATSVDGMIRKLCRDVGVNPEENPEVSLSLQLKNIKSKVIFVMDNIDNLLDDKSKVSFCNFIRDLRKNSKHCQIVTTSRMSYKIPNIAVSDVKVGEMSLEECMKLLRKKCPEQTNVFLEQIAELCGKIPLAMCIAGSRVDDFEDPGQLLKHLQHQPMKFLKCPESDQFVYKAINMSYEKCSEEEKDTLVRLAVFDGSFSEKAANAVHEKDDLDTTNNLKTLVCRSLTEQPLRHRYSIHLLIKQFLLEQGKGQNEMAKRVQGQVMRAELLMVKYYLKLGTDLTMKSYSKNGYEESIESLKKEVHNIQNVLEIFCKQNHPATSDICECLAKSEIYTTSARHFSLFVRPVIPNCIVNEFLQQCTNIAEKKQHHAIKMNFDCFFAGRIKAIGKSYILDLDATKSRYLDLDAKMKKIQEEYKIHKKDFEKDKSLSAHYYFQCGKYLMQKSRYQYHHQGKNCLDLQNCALEQLKQSLKLRREQLETLLKSDIPEASVEFEIDDTVYSLLQVGNAHKLIAGDDAKDSANLSEAEKYLNEAIQLSEENLGDHDLTAWCHKYLGDLFLTTKKFEQAEKEYNIVKTIWDNLGLNANRRHVFLLNNMGQCYLQKDIKQTDEAIEILESARDMAEKLAKDDEPNLCKTEVYVSLAIAYDLARMTCDAVKYAKKALKFQGAIIDENKLEKIKKISEKET